MENQISPNKQGSTLNLVLVASIAAGVQFGWAIQLALLTPYVQLLGIPHKWAAYIWLCGPISGLIVQPTVGYYSDRCTSRWGRRTPFIAGGAIMVILSVFLIGFAADIGHAAGDPTGNVTKPRAIVTFIVGFWILDVANNTLQGPCRALLADLAAGSQSKTRIANTYFSLFMAVGNVLGYAAGAWRGLHKRLPFTNTLACDVYCANLKSCFLISAVILIILTVTALLLVRESPYSPQEEPDQEESTNRCAKIPILGQFTGAIHNLPRSMWILLLVTALNWIAWFPFILFDTDWMGKEVFGGEARGSGEGAYTKGVNMGALGLMLNSVVLGLMSLVIEALTRVLGGAPRLWGIVNVILTVCLGLTVWVTKSVQEYRRAHYDPQSSGPPLPPVSIKGGALAIFVALGIPLAVTYSIPFAMASILSASSGSGQGLSLGVLNLAIVIPQMFVSITSGPWDDAFGGGNLPAFVAGAVSAAASVILCFTLLPSSPTHKPSASLEMSPSQKPSENPSPSTRQKPRTSPKESIHKSDEH